MPSFIDNSTEKASAFFAKMNDVVFGYQNASIPKRFIKGYGQIVKGSAPFVVGFGAYNAFTAPTGHKISAAVGGGASIGISMALGLGISAMTGLPPLLTDAIVQGLLVEPLDKGIQAFVQPMVDFGYNMRRVNMGGDYRDSQMAYTMRAAAARDMSTSLMNARQWLGQEGAFMHQ